MAAETLGEESDRELVKRFLAQRDEAVFEALVRRHGPMVYRVCWRVLQYSQDTEDAFQATFLLLAQKLRTVRNRDSLASWLHGVAHRVALKAKAQAARRRRHERRASVSEAVPPDEVTWKELRTILDAELTCLPERLRLPLILCYLEGRTQEEAAGQLRLSKSTLLRRLEEARTALGGRLTRRGVVWPAALAAAVLSDGNAPAALPPGLIGSTGEAAASIAAGQTAAAGLISAKAAALTEGVMKTMWLNNLKIAAIVLLSASFAIAGTAALTVPGLVAGQRTAAPGATLPPATRDEGKAPRAAPKPDEVKAPKPDHLDRLFGRLGGLPADLVKTQKSVAEIVDAVFLATLARLPAEPERAAAVKHLQQAKDRSEAGRDIVWALLNSSEFLKLHHLDGNVPESLRLLNKLGAEWDAKPAPEKSEPKKPHSKEPKGANDDQEKLRGTWEGLAHKNDGTGENPRRGVKLVIAADKITVSGMSDAGDVELAYRLDPAKKPKAIDLTTGKDFADVCNQGIYELDGDTLQICYGIGGTAERPTEFCTKPGAAQWLFVLKRRAAEGKSK
jgi:RNA polymerase sigma factor (sigma-70 family)